MGARVGPPFRVEYMFLSYSACYPLPDRLLGSARNSERGFYLLGCGVLSDTQGTNSPPLETTTGYKNDKLNLERPRSWRALRYNLNMDLPRFTCYAKRQQRNKKKQEKRE